MGQGRRILGPGRPPARLLARRLRLEWKPEVRRFQPSVRECGIEDLGFQFPARTYQGHFSELGFNAVAMSGVADCWARRLHLVNSDSGLWFEAIPPQDLHPQNLHQSQWERRIGVMR